MSRLIVFLQHGDPPVKIAFRIQRPDNAGAQRPASSGFFFAREKAAAQHSL